ncbi:putative extracellular sulfatase Sulf-1 homolog [Eurytemora carolleeae]|uniref:putative extracellular sulfatase Sulf-1 homolog n=1 Tax=Eurytemora carolleeae TaxID=1294199 RepID=UPI000C783949|nr:putative extracellular sulfatase Sulf-1 homolog [Eurytemora carolleeae]|eukprot:XP_023327891.1 putative extracellular sulfatase Sulf-1 homolog [Eurytemora affinis]
MNIVTFLLLSAVLVMTAAKAGQQTRQNRRAPFNRSEKSGGKASFIRSEMGGGRGSTLRNPQSPTYGTKQFKPVYTARVRNEAKEGKRPNIILILTDDQDVELGSLQFMPKLAKYMGKAGTTYSNGFVSTPMCCPSRSSLLTGLYVHNHKVYTNNDNCSSTYWVENHEPRSFGAYLQDAGYSTGYFGKYLNKYHGTRVPTGWGEWHGLVRNSRFYNYSLNVNGQIHHHGFDYERDYLPDVITNRSLNFLRWSKAMDPNTPLLTVLSYPGPHGPEDSAPQYQHLFFNVTTHHTPAYDFAPNPDKQWILRHTEKMQPIHKHFTDMLMTKRLQTLQSVDDAVERIVTVLDELDELDNTFIFYTSDHGYHLGQYGLVKGKAFPFDVDTKVPFLVRGPGVPSGLVLQEPVLNIDLAPTFLDIAGLQKPPHMDGKSILSTLFEPAPGAPKPEPWRSAILLERGKMTFQRYAKVSQSSNDVLDSEFQDLLTSEELTRQERLKIECKKPRYKAPCTPHQKLYCKEKSDGDFKIKRCRMGIAERFGLAERKSSCHCNPGDVYGWKYSKLDADEKKMQKRFLRQHVPKSRKLNQKFLKTLPRYAVGQSRTARGADDLHFDHIFEDVAHDELEEVDGLVEDIAEEIRDLHNLNGTDDSLGGCKLDRENVVCSNDIVSDKKTWAISRNTVKQQIQRLRAQLNELKQIRKYLRIRRPETSSRGRVLPLDLRAYNIEAVPEDAWDNSEICVCEHKTKKELDRQLIREERMRTREQIKLEKMRRKERRRLKMEKKERKKNSAKKNDHCKQDLKMNCFSHDNDHWRTAPLWTEGSFCACTNSNNNTYWCVRNINTTHNYLYCEYVTGMVTYFDLQVDPHQLRNVLHTLTDLEVNYMHSQVIYLREYSAENDYMVELEDRRMATMEDRRIEQKEGRRMEKENKMKKRMRVGGMLEGRRREGRKEIMAARLKMRRHGRPGHGSETSSSAF